MNYYLNYTIKKKNFLKHHFFELAFNYKDKVSIKTKNPGLVLQYKNRFQI